MSNQILNTKKKQILDAYLECAIFCDKDNILEQDENADLNIYNVSEESKTKALEDIQKFLELAGNAINGITDESIGHDLWFTRNGHGVGFCDRGYEKSIGDKLSNAARELGGKTLILGDDGQLYIE